MSRTRRPSVRAIAVAAIAALALAGCGGDDPTVDVEAPEVPEEEPVEEEPEEPEETVEPEVPDEADATEDDEAVASTSSPTPDPNEVDDPCADHQGREDEAFIEVVSPVDDQEPTGDEVELVGCSNVYEANVQWTLYDGDGVELDSGFTTAECGNGCVGAFETTVSLEEAAGEPFAELHVFADDAAGSGDPQYLTAIPLVLS
ncbi:MAG: Gmad2 immunoglobulin-like domain-containing protein [Nitriliruptor sp.]